MLTKRRPSIASVVLIVTLVVSCKGRDRDRDKVNPNKPVAQGMSVGDRPPTVTLLEPGGEPRAKRVATFSAGTSFKTRVSITSVNEVAQAGSRGKKFPADVTTIDVAFAVGSVAAGATKGAATITKLEMRTLDKDKPLPEADVFLNKPWPVELGAHGGVVALESSTVALTEKAMVVREDLANAIRVMFVAIPDAPLGIGAKWSVETKILPPAGGTRSEAMTYELVGETDGVLELRVSGTARASGPGVKADAVVRGSVLVARRAWQPARTAIAKQMQLTVAQGGRDLAIEQHGRLEVAPSGPEIPAMRATCEQTASCCAAMTAELTPVQRDDCTKAAKSGDVAACSQQYSTLQRALLLLGRTNVAACR